MERPGFYPRGGGRIHAEIDPAPALQPFDLLERGPLRARRAEAIVAGLPESIARRELDTVRAHLGHAGPAIVMNERSFIHCGPGNAVLIELASEHVTEVFSAIGERGIPAETVAAAAAREAIDYLDAGAPVGPHLADQLVLLLAIAGGGRFRTGPPTGHTRTQADVIPLFLPVSIAIRAVTGSVHEVEVLPK
jgi:RNA 3'-terminal phosphate cyclase (ATP)